MVSSHHEDKTKNTSSRRSGSSRASTTRKSHRSNTSSRKSGSSKQGSRSPNRSEPRRSKRSKEDLEAKEKARAERGNTAAELGAVDHTGAIIEPVLVEEEGRSSSRNKPRKSNRRSQQDKGVPKDATAKVKYLLDRSNEANAGPAPGAHADSRGDEVAKDDQKSGKGRFNRPLGTQSVFTMEERVRMEAEKGQDQDGLVMASAVDEIHDEGLARALLNSMLDQQMVESGNKKSTKNTKNKPDKTKKSGDQREERQDQDEGKGWENSKLKKGVQFFRLLCCIIVLGAAGIGAWIALRDNNNSMSDTNDPSSSGGAPNVTTDIDILAPSNSTDDPFSTLNPNNPNATSAPSGTPGSNIGADVIFEPPSEEDCAAISNGGAIQGQNEMPTQSYLLDLDATPFLPMDLSISAGMIEEKLIDLLTPSVTGCDQIVRKLGHAHRHLVDGFSYAIGNVMVDALGVEGVPCIDISNPQCHRVSVTLDIVVKDESVKVTAVITELSLFFGGGDLASKLELVQLYESIKVANLGSTDQTKSPITPDTSPSMEPTKSPSVVTSPNLLETSIPTASPTRGPSTSISTPLPTSPPVVQETTISPTTTLSPPTPGPTPPPTPQPGPQGTPPTSLPPTSRPTPFPTFRPTPFPTPRPVADPTPSPSTSPSEAPSTRPTNAPVVESPLRSETPTEAPSANPSKTPSSSPSFGPSRTPSLEPSNQPSASPSHGPSTAPSLRPSTAPSTAPTPAPIPAPTPPPSDAPVPSISLSTNRCAYLESVLGNRASLHQLAFDWMCNVDTWEPIEGESYPEQWHDRYAVVAFYYAASGDDPNTFNSSQFSGASTQSTCTWLALTSWVSSCLQTTVGSKVIRLHGMGHMVFGDLYSPSGYVPSAIGLLTNLEQLWAARIPLPSEIGLLTALQDFNFAGQDSFSQLGTIPTEIGLLTNLVTISGVKAGLKGTIPSELMNLTELAEMRFTLNQLSGTIPPSIILLGLQILRI